MWSYAKGKFVGKSLPSSLVKYEIFLRSGFDFLYDEAGILYYSNYKVTMATEGVNYYLSVNLPRFIQSPTAIDRCLAVCKKHKHLWSEKKRIHNLHIRV